MATTDTLVTSAIKMVPSPGSGEWYFAVLLLVLGAVVVGLRWVDKKFRSPKDAEGPSESGLPCAQHSKEIAERRTDYIKISDELHNMELRIIDRMDEKLAEERKVADQRDSALRRELSETRVELTERIDDRLDKLEGRLVASIGAMFQSSANGSQHPFKPHKG